VGVEEVTHARMYLREAALERHAGTGGDNTMLEHPELRAHSFHYSIARVRRTRIDSNDDHASTILRTAADASFLHRSRQHPLMPMNKGGLPPR
jgi:hypothetical protein